MVCEITNLVAIFRKNKMKNASIPKFSILPPISDEILPRLCSDDPVQIFFQLVWFLTLRTKPFLEGLEHNCGTISPTICTNILIIGKAAFLVLIDLSDDLNKSHKLIKFPFCDVTLYHSMCSNKDLNGICYTSISLFAESEITLEVHITENVNTNRTF